MTRMYDSHGDVLAIKVHKHNSLEHLKPNRSRPSSAMPRHRAPPPAPVLAGQPPRRARPQSAAPRMQKVSQPSLEFSGIKSLAQKNIDGEMGPKMIGVTTYPYSNPQRLYLQDFRALVANTITHPYMATTGFNVGSAPHDILAGSNFDDDRFAPAKKWRSEYGRTYVKKSIVEAKTAEACGVRSEQIC